MDRTEDHASAHDPNLLAAYAEGRLDDGERRLMTGHLAGCGECRAVLAMLARSSAAVTAPPRRSAVPVWMAVAATVVLAVLGVRRTEGPATPSTTVPASTVPSVVPATSAPVSPTTDARPPATPDPMLDPDLLVKRGVAQRRVAGKTFRRSAGQWLDAEFDPTGTLPSVAIAGREARDAAVQRLPALAPYAALGDRVVVVLDGTVYRFTP